MSLAGDRSDASSHARESQNHVIESVTCLGCGCSCDDIRVQVRDGRISRADNACAIGEAWFGDGRVPARTRVDGRDVPAADAIDAIAEVLASAKAPLIYVAPELSCEAQREAIGLADVLHASLDTVTTSTALASIVASQERGRAGATLGEIRNRADVLLFWGVDPRERYPRYLSRYAPEPEGVHIGGRSARTVVAVDVGSRRGPADADVRFEVPADQELDTLVAMEAMVRRPAMPIDGALWTQARDIVERLTAASYLVIVADAEPAGAGAPPAGGAGLARASALIALAQSLNGPTRCALSTLRAGGNRPGADSVLTSQTGYPAAVSFVHGFPTYRPFDPPKPDVVLVIGAAALIPEAASHAWTDSTLVVIGPRASEHAGARIAIDTGIAGIHHQGTAVRMDDVPLPLKTVIDGPANPLDILRQLTKRATESGGPAASAPGALRHASPEPRREGPPLRVRTAQESTR